MLVEGLNFGDEWFDSVDGRREVFTEVTHNLEEMWCVSTSGSVMHDLRQTALEQAKSEDQNSGDQSCEDVGKVTELIKEKFLEIEIVGIYW